MVKLKSAYHIKYIINNLQLGKIVGKVVFILKKIDNSTRYSISDKLRR